VDSIKNAYADTHFIPEFKEVYRKISDEDRLRLSKERLAGSKALWRGAIELLDNIGEANIDKESEYIIEELGEELNLMIMAHKILGSKRIVELDYDKRKIETALGNIRENNLLTSEDMRKKVYGKYHTGDEVAVNELNEYIRQLIKEHGIPYQHRVDRGIVQLFFDITDKRTSSTRYYVLGRKNLPE
jgi:hypothetical protein